MTHRDAEVALAEERERMMERLAALELDRSDGAARERAALDAQLDDVARSLELHAPARRLPVLAVAPRVHCDASWEGMEGDARTRRCGTCQRAVFDLRAMTPVEIERFLATRASPKLRLHRRTDGRYQSGACPRAQTRRRARMASAVVTITLGILWLAVPSEAAPMPVAPLAPLAPFDAAAFVAPPAPTAMDIAASRLEASEGFRLPGHSVPIQTVLDLWLTGGDSWSRNVVGRAIYARRSDIWACIEDPRMHQAQWTSATELEITVHPDGEVLVSRVRGRALARCFVRAFDHLALAARPRVTTRLQLRTRYSTDGRSRPADAVGRMYSFRRTLDSRVMPRAILADRRDYGYVSR